VIYDRLETLIQQVRVFSAETIGHDLDDLPPFSVVSSCQAAPVSTLSCVQLGSFGNEAAGRLVGIYGGHILDLWGECECPSWFEDGLEDYPAGRLGALHRVGGTCALGPQTQLLKLPSSLDARASDYLPVAWHGGPKSTQECHDALVRHARRAQSFSTRH